MSAGAGLGSGDAAGAGQPAPEGSSKSEGGWALALLREREALCEGHFRLSSGLHAERYVQCQAVMGEPDAAGRLAAALADRFRPAGISAVIGPALGAIVLAHDIARAVGCRSLFAERAGDGGFVLRRGQRLAPDERVLVAENVVTTGGSARKVVELVRRLGAQPVGVAALVDRSPAGTRPFGDVRFEALLRLDIATWAPADCPRCARGEPITTPGSSPDPAAGRAGG